MASLSSGSGSKGNNLSNNDLARIAAPRATRAVKEHITESNLLEPDSLKESVRLVGLRQAEHLDQVQLGRVKPPPEERLRDYSSLDGCPMTLN